METVRAILGRRAVRSYENGQVPREMIDSILKAGAMAPSAMDAQPCRFVVITDRSVIGKLSDRVKVVSGSKDLGARTAERMKSKEDVVFYGAPLLILIVAERTEWSSMDCALAAQNMMLRAYDLGLGSCFVGYATMLKDDRKTLRSVGVEDSQELYCPLIFGHPKEWPAPKDRKAIVQKIMD
jgi:nitroreductase